MSDDVMNQGSERSGISRRTVMKGAAWSLPVVAVASAAPAMAASRGPLTFTGRACKLPGNANDIFKGYVFELVADNTVGPNPLDAVTVVTSVTVNGVDEPNYTLVPKDPTCGCALVCGPAGTPATHQFCTPEGVIGQRILLYTGAEPLAGSPNTNICITYIRYECDCSPVLGAELAESVCSGERSTPPVTSGGGSCQIPDVLPLPVA